jgi:hypothetical protein
VAVSISPKLRLTLREGSVYYFTQRTLTSVEPHYFIVVNSEPLLQEVLLLSVVTSKVEKVRLRRRAHPGTLVEIGPADLPGILSKPSIVDCNSIQRVPLEEFNTRFTTNEIKTFGSDIPAPLRDALCRAIHASIVVPEEWKHLIRQA